ncbi:MAG TPA: hypothetical protein VGN20_04260 [Mucilaginibacter sp.]|jgi:hypothetical protein
MKEVTVRYKTNKTLQALKDMGKYLGFTVDEQSSEKKDKLSFINGVPVIPGDNSIDITDLYAVFTGKELNAAELRNSGWQRKK